MAAETGKHSSPHPALRALGRSEPPAQLELDGTRLALVRPLQHSFFSATALYEDERGERVIYKAGREASLFGLPLRFLGRLLARHELDVYAALDGVDGVPQGPVPVSDTAFVRPFVDGHTLERGERVDDDFFPRLVELLERVHARDVAVVDFQKPDNVLVGADGRPHLFDFGASWRLRGSGLQRIVPRGLRRRVLARLQAGDRFHLLKHWRRSRPDTISPEQLASSSRPGAFIRVHRQVHNRWRAFRRWLFSRGRDAGDA